MSKSVILCVDDEITVLTSLRDQLAQYLDDNYQIELAESAEEAMELVEEISKQGIEVPIIISDQIMPGVKGDELLVKIHSRYPKSLKIFLTGQATLQNIGNVINQATLHAYITKPWDENNIKLVVNKALRSYFLDKQLNEHRELLLNSNRNLEEKVKERTKELEMANQNLKKALEEARIASKEAEKANKAKSDFISNISHELRTPMNAIIGFTNLLLDMELGHNQLDYLKKIQISSNSLLEIINNILDLSKIEAGYFALEYIEFNLDSILEQLYSIFSINAQGKGIKLLRYPTIFEIGILKGDPLRLKQILMNLLSNAFKFTKKGEISIKTEIIKKIQDKVIIQFEVKDTGIGIPKEKMLDLFNPFTQANSSTARKYGGTGLGLAISKRLVEMMNGDISLESEIGKGSILKFTAEFGYIEDNNSKIDNNDQDYDLKMVFNGKKILIVDDNLFNRILTSGILRNMGVIVEEAESGEEAINMLLKKDSDIYYNAILMDIQMPNMDGLEATRRIRTYERFFKLPIIAITACAMEDDIKDCFESGMNDYMSKPFTAKQIYLTLKKWIF